MENAFAFLCFDDFNDAVATQGADGAEARSNARSSHKTTGRVPTLDDSSSSEDAVHEEEDDSDSSASADTRSAVRIAGWEILYEENVWKGDMEHFPILHGMSRLKPASSKAPVSSASKPRKPGSKANLRTFTTTEKEIILDCVTFYRKHYKEALAEATGSPSRDAHISIPKLLELINNSNTTLQLKERTYMNYLAEREALKHNKDLKPKKSKGRPPKGSAQFRQELRDMLVVKVLEEERTGPKKKNGRGNVNATDPAQPVKLFERIYNTIFSLRLIAVMAVLLATSATWKASMEGTSFSDSWSRRFIIEERYVRRKITSKIRNYVVDEEEMLKRDDLIYSTLKSFPRGAVAMGDETAARADPPTHQYLFKDDADRGLRAQSPPNADERMTVTAMVAATDEGEQLPTFSIINHAGDPRADLSDVRVLTNLQRTQEGPNSAKGFSEDDGWRHRYYKVSLKMKFKKDSVARNQTFIIPFLIKESTGCIITIQTKGWMDVVRLCMYFDLVVKPFMNKKRLDKFAYVYDNCAAHTSPVVQEFAAKLGITLVMLYPNTTPVRCILDIAVNKELKRVVADLVAMEWVQQLQAYRNQVHQAHAAQEPPPPFTPLKVSIRSIIHKLREVTLSLNDANTGLSSPKYKKIFADWWIKLGFRDDAQGIRHKLKGAHHSGLEDVNYRSRVHFLSKPENAIDSAAAANSTSDPVIPNGTRTNGMRSYELLGLRFEFEERATTQQVEIDDNETDMQVDDDNETDMQVDAADPDSILAGYDQELLELDIDLKNDDHDVPVPQVGAANSDVPSNAGPSAPDQPALSCVFESKADLRANVGPKKRGEQGMITSAGEIFDLEQESVPEVYAVGTSVEGLIVNVAHPKGGRQLKKTWYQGIIQSVVKHNKSYMVLFDDGEVGETLVEELRPPQLHTFEPKVGGEVFTLFDVRAFPKEADVGKQFLDKWYHAVVQKVEYHASAAQPQYRCTVKFMDEILAAKKDLETPAEESDWLYVASHVREAFPLAIVESTKVYEEGTLRPRYNPNKRRAPAEPPAASRAHAGPHGRKNKK